MWQVCCLTFIYQLSFAQPRGIELIVRLVDSCNISEQVKILSDNEMRMEQEFDIRRKLRKFATLVSREAVSCIVEHLHVAQPIEWSHFREETAGPWYMHQ